MPEILNLDYNRQLLILKALNKYRFKTHAYRALGVSEKQGYNLMKYHEVRWSKERGYYSERIVEFKKENEVENANT